MEGYAAERARLADLLDQASAGRTTCLLVSGDPGIGKTTLLREAAGQRDGTWWVLRATGVEAEQSLSFAGLVSLLLAWSPEFDRAGPSSAETLRSVVERGEPAAALALGVAVLQLLSGLAADRPLLVVLDDAHWLDEPTLDALRFAARRLDREPVAVVAAARPGTIAPFDGGDVLEMEGIDADSARVLLSGGGPVTAEVALACTDACGGNPLALLEIDRHLTDAQRLGRAPLPAPLPIGEGLSRAVRSRVVELPPRTRDALLVVALAGSLPRAILDAALERRGLHRDDLADAVGAGVLAADGTGSNFRHPLLRTATVAAASPGARSAAHRALADATSGFDDERHAWHLADAAEGNPEVAPDALGALTRLATRATEQGAHLAAARAWDRAATLAPTRSERAACQLAAGLAFTALFVPHDAVVRLRAALDDAEPGEQRARVAFALTDMLGWGYSTADAVQLGGAEARAVERSHPALAATVLAEAANIAGLGGNLRIAVELAARAEQIAERAEPLDRFAARVVGTHLRIVHGEALEIPDRIAELDLLRDVVVPDAAQEVLQLGQLAGFAYMVTERWDDALAVLDSVSVGARRLAHRGMENFALAMRGEVLWRLGRWPEARAESMVDALYSERVETAGSFGAATVARTEAAVGLVDDALRRAELAVRRGEATRMGVLTAWGRHAEALAHLASGRPDDALDALDWIWRLCRQGEVGDPGPLWWQGDLLEAQIATGRHDDAGRLVAQLDAEASATGRQWATAVALRGTALLRDDRVAAARSVTVLDALGARFEAARSRLVLADLLDGAERDTELVSALDSFQSLGARPWEDRARAALGQRRWSDERSAVASALTEGELRVALAVGRGLTNREAAANLALSPKTVDAHLRSIYRKLEVRSRTELALLVAAERTVSGTPPVPGPPTTARPASA